MDVSLKLDLVDHISSAENVGFLSAAWIKIKTGKNLCPSYITPLQEQEKQTQEKKGQVLEKNNRKAKGKLWNWPQL